MMVQGIKFQQAKLGEWLLGGLFGATRTRRRRVFSTGQAGQIESSQA